MEKKPIIVIEKLCIFQSSYFCDYILIKLLSNFFHHFLYYLIEYTYISENDVITEFTIVIFKGFIQQEKKMK